MFMDVPSRRAIVFVLFLLATGGPLSARAMVSDDFNACALDTACGP